MNQSPRRFTGVEPLWSTYIHAKASALGIPLSGNFELTARCNFNCKMCYVHQQSDASRELTAAEWLEIGRVARDAGMVFLLLTGGEPLMRKDFKEIYTGLKKLGLLISINTNGALLDREWVEFFRKDPPLRFNISLYGGSEATYRALCGHEGHRRVTENIRALLDAGMQVRLNASITPENCDDIPEIYSFGESMGIPVKGTAYMFPPARINGLRYGDAPYRFSPEEAAARTLQCREQYMTPEELANGIPDASADPIEDCTDGQGERMRCRAGKTAFWITWDGRMLPCGMFPQQGYDLRATPFLRAWEAVKQDTIAITLPAVCRECPHKDQCPACAAACLAESGDASACPTYVCTMTKTLHCLTAEKYLKKES